MPFKGAQDIIGDNMPLNNPRSRSSRIMVVNAWNVDLYLMAVSGDWKRTFTTLLYIYLVCKQEQQINVTYSCQTDVQLWDHRFLWHWASYHYELACIEETYLQQFLQWNRWLGLLSLASVFINLSDWSMTVKLPRLTFIFSFSLDIFHDTYTLYSVATYKPACPQRLLSTNGSKHELQRKKQHMLRKVFWNYVINDINMLTTIFEFSIREASRLNMKLIYHNTMNISDKKVQIVTGFLWTFLKLRCT